jgi:hypothetical protein
VRALLNALYTFPEKFHCCAQSSSQIRNGLKASRLSFIHACEDPLFHSRPRCLFQNNRRTPSIDLGAFIRFLDRFLHTHHSREMKDKVHALHSLYHETAIEN